MELSFFFAKFEQEYPEIFVIRNKATVNTRHCDYFRHQGYGGNRREDYVEMARKHLRSLFKAEVPCYFS